METGPTCRAITRRAHVNILEIDVNLSARITHTAPLWCAVGATVQVVAPTLFKPLIGTVAEVNGVTVTLHTLAGMYVAVDIEDCRRHSTGHLLPMSQQHN